MEKVEIKENKQLRKKTKRLRITVEIVKITRQEYIVDAGLLDKFQNYPGDPQLLNIFLDYRENIFQHTAEVKQVKPTNLKEFKSRKIV